MNQSKTDLGIVNESQLLRFGIRRIKAMIGNRPIDIEVDGGVTPETAPLVVKAGASVLVAGSAIFKGGKAEYCRNIAAIRSARAD